MLFAALVLALPLASLASAASAASPTRRDDALARGIERYQKLDYEAACPLFEEAGAVASARQAEALAWAGLCRAALGTPEDARARFRAALALDAHVTLPADAPPKVRELFEQERRARAAPTVPSPSSSPSSAQSPEGAPEPRPRLQAALWGAGGLVLLLGVGAGAIGVVEGLRALDANRRLQDARGDERKTARVLTALATERDTAALVANVAFAALAGTVLLGGGLVGAGFLVE